MKLLTRIKQYLSPESMVEIVALGHQKSGTTAIATLLGEISGWKSSSVEPLYGMDMGPGKIADKIMQDPQKLNYYCHRYPKYFGHRILKDTDLIFVYPEVKRLFKKAKFIFIIRDPRDTIRSICNRLGLPGDHSSASMRPDDMKSPTRHWELIMSSRLPQIPGIKVEFSNYIVNLANRWKLATNIYQEDKDNFVLIKYEDFIMDKEGSIANLARSLNLPVSHSISHLVDVQYQRKGDSNVDWLTFFGQENIKMVEEICKKEMKEFSYEPYSIE